MVEYSNGEVPIPHCIKNMRFGFLMKTVPYSETIKIIVNPPIKSYCPEGKRLVEVHISTTHEVTTDLCAGNKAKKIPPCPFYIPYTEEGEI